MRTKWTQMSAREAMIELVGNPGYGEQSRFLERVANAAKISIRAARDLWRGDIDSRDHKAFKALKIAVESKRKDEELRKARAEAQVLAAQFQKIIGGMRATDENFFSSQIAEYERLVREIGTVDRT